MSWKQTVGRPWLGSMIGAILAMFLGVLFYLPLGDGLVRSSYDLLYVFRGDLAPSEAVIVYLDDASFKELGQDPAKPWKRGLHAQLLERLTDANARAIVLDFIWNQPDTDPAGDERLIQALRRHGNVVLPALYLFSEEPGMTGRTLDQSAEPIRQAAAAEGTANFRPDPDRGNRLITRYFMADATLPSLAWATAERLQVPAVTADKSGQSFWLNYYGPPGTIPNLSYHTALVKGSVPGSFFSNKIVFIGSKPSAGLTGDKLEEFANPYTRWTGKFSPGVEVHATAFLNLLRHEGLQRLPPGVELLTLVLAGFILGYGLVLVQPLPATGLALGSALAVAAGTWMLTWHQHYWFPWLIVAAVQVPAACAWSVVFNSLQTYIEKRLLEHSLSMYVSVPRARQLLKHPELLRPGAEQVQISILFSDIDKFSTITERTLPKDLVKLLNDYFEISINCIHQPEGTVMKLIGDAIFAIWNAPESQPNHQERACRAALLLREQLAQFDRVHKTLPLRTRIGLHFGPAYVGNFGSERRFDYTAIGDSINLTSRLEGLNKFLNTQILASREILAEVEDLFVSCPVGHFKLKGFDRVIEVHELLGTQECAARTRIWREPFTEALQRFQRRDFSAAEQALLRTLEAAPDHGPAKFYLEKIQEFRLHPPPSEWAGEIDLKEK
jgi:adenylate cyclase